MKKKLICALALALSLAFAPAAFAAEDLPAVTCGSYIIVDAETGQVLLEQNADEQRCPASITKIMTLGLALEKADGDLDHTLTVSEEDAYSLVGTDSSYIALQPEEEVELEDILYATHMVSANDGANVLAAYFGGSIAGGVQAMNEKVEELGLSGTHFVNPHGLMDENHYTTARDMAAITRWALEQPEFETIFCRTDSWEMGPTNKQPVARQFGCSDWMKVGDQKKRDYALGSKSGYHDQAGQTFVTLCQQNDMRLICVLMGSATKGEKFGDACALMDYCFDRFQKVELAAEEKAFSVPVRGGGELLGKAKAPSRAVEVILHKENLKTGYTMEYTLPESYTIGTPFEGVQKVNIVGNGWQQDSSAEFAMRCTGLQAVFEEAKGTVLPAGKPERNWGGMIAVAGAGAAGLLALGWLLKRRAAQKNSTPYAAGEEWTVISRERTDGPTVSFKSSRRQDTRRRDDRPVNPRR